MLFSYIRGVFVYCPFLLDLFIMPSGYFPLFNIVKTVELCHNQTNYITYRKLNYEKKA